ncbi:putative translation initiation factor IF-2, N-terminal region [Trypoxylus dichotomus]
MILCDKKDIFKEKSYRMTSTTGVMLAAASAAINATVTAAVDASSTESSPSVIQAPSETIFLQTKLAQGIAGTFVWAALFVTCQQLSPFVYSQTTKLRIQIRTHHKNHQACGSESLGMGCFSYYGVVPSFEVDGIMGQLKYVQIFNEVMFSYAEDIMLLKWILMQDMDCTAHSPDLNPIENLWADIKKAVCGVKLKTGTKLWEVIQALWFAVSSERCQQLFDTMPRRCCAAIANKEYATKY